MRREQSGMTHLREVQGEAEGVPKRKGICAGQLAVGGRGGGLAEAVQALVQRSAEADLLFTAMLPAQDSAVRLWAAAEAGCMHARPAHKIQATEDTECLGIACLSLSH